MLFETRTFKIMSAVITALIIYITALIILKDQLIHQLYKHTIWHLHTRPLLGTYTKTSMQTP
jgi:hypothetical protein